MSWKYERDFAYYAAAAAAVLHVMCQQSEMKSALGASIFGHAMAQWNKGSARVRAMADRAADIPLELLQKGVQEAQKLLDSLGLGGLVRPVMNLLESGVSGIRGFLQRTGAVGWAVVYLLAAWLILRVVRG